MRRQTHPQDSDRISSKNKEQRSMGNLLYVDDLWRQSTHDYVDNQYFSVQQVAVKLFALKNPVRVMDVDKGKVLLFVNLTMEEHRSEETK